MPTERKQDLAIARDSSLVPTAEADLDAISLSTDAEQVVSFPDTGCPLILLVQGDGDFLEGDDAPDQDNDLVRAADTIHSIPVSGRSAWHFKRASGAGTVTLKMKLYLGN